MFLVHIRNSRRLITVREEYVTPKELPVVLNTTLAQAPDLMQRHITDPLWSGEMLSKDELTPKS